jgi:hypothetical protein
MTYLFCRDLEKYIDCKNKYKVAAQIGITIKEGAQNNNIYTLGVAV